METPVADNIVHKALALAGAHITEIQVNQGWQPNKLYPTFTQDMKSVGWYVGGEWCAFSGILIWKQAYSELAPKVWAYIKGLLSGNSQETARNAHTDKFWPTGLVPKPGCIVIWQAGDSSTQGHFGICISVNGDQFITAEGNTSDPGSPDTRTGWTYACHTHTLGLPHSSKNLNFLRAVYAVEEADFDNYMNAHQKGV